MLAWLSSLALATPYWTALPADPVDAMQTEVGVGAGAAVVPEAELVVPVLSSWARWGATDRVELSGGAWVPLNPAELALHGLARAQVAGATDGGLALTVGAGAGVTLGSGILAVSAPVQVGHTGTTGGVWASAAPVLYPSLEGLAVTGAVEAGGAVDVRGLPLYVLASTEVGALLGVSAIVGVGLPFFDW